jgi:hypothetical protein
MARLSPSPTITTANPRNSKTTTTITTTRISTTVPGRFAYAPAEARLRPLVQDSAHHMSNWQMEVCIALTINPRADTFRYPRVQWLLPSWCSSFANFNPIPFAAALIGQVHHTILAPPVSPTGRLERVAVKIQFPNIEESVAGDLIYNCILLTTGQLFSRRLFLNKAVDVLRALLFCTANGWSWL